VARPFSPEDRFRIAAGLLAGLITAAAVLLFWVLWGGDPFTPHDLVEEPATAPPAPLEERVDPLAPDPVGPVIGVREQRLLTRLRRVSPPPPRPIAAFEVRARDIVWRDPAGSTWARAAAITGRVDARAAQRGDIVVAATTVTRPRVTLRQDERGDWNWQAVFAELLDADPPVDAPRLFTLRDVRIVDGHVDVLMPDERFTITGADATLASLTFSDPQRRDPNLVLRTFAGTLAMPDRDLRLAITAGDGLARFPAGGVFFDLARAEIDGIRLADLSGEWSDRVPGIGVRVAGRALAVELAALERFLPEPLPVDGTATLAFQYEPLTDLRTSITLSDIDLAADGSRVFGALTVWLEPDRIVLREADLRLDPLALALIESVTGPLPYDGSLRGTVTGEDGDIAFDLIATLTAPGVPAPFAVDLTGRALMTVDGVALQLLEAELRAVPLVALRPLVPGLPLRGTVSGTAVLRGPPAIAPLELDVRLEVAAGLVTLAGVFDLTGDVARYDLAGRLIGINMQTLLEPDVPPVALTARFTLAGTGFDPATAVASITVDGRFTGWQAGPSDLVLVEAQLRRGELDVASLSMRLATLELEASGIWRFIDPIGGAIAYTLTVTDVRPFGPYVPLLGDELATGSLAASGTVGGTLARLRIDGRLAARAFQLGDWAVHALDATYAAVLGEPVPQIVLDADATRLQTPTAGVFDVAMASVRLAPPTFALELLGERRDAAGLHVVAEGLVPAVGPREAIVQRMNIDLERQRWALVAPARLRWGEAADGVIVERFELIDAVGPGRVRIEGRILPLERIDATIETAALPVGEIQRLLGQPPIVTGMLWMNAQVLGPGEDPRVVLEFRLDEAALEGVAIAELNGELRYEAGRLEASARTVLAEAGMLDIEASVPLQLTLVGVPAVTLLDAGVVSGRAVADSLRLAPLAVLSPFVRDAAGVVHGQVELSGTVGEPVFAGRVQLVDGAATFPDLRQRYTEGFADVELTGQQVILHEFRARSGGWLTASGAITFVDLATPTFELTADLDRFRAVDARDRRGPAVSGVVRLAGEAASPVLTGRVRLDEGTIEIPEFGPPEVDMFLDLADAPMFGDPTLLPAPLAPAWHDPIRIQGFVIEAGDNLWIEGFNARLQLTGELTIDRVGEDLRIFGTLDGTRGQYILSAGPIVRRFDIVAAQVRFLGTGELNPPIDITARRRVIDPGGRHLSVDVRITGTARNPQLALASPDAAQMPQSELLSFLIFGQPSFALGGGVVPGETLLEEILVGGLAELATIELEQAIVQDLGLPVDVLQIRWGAGRFGGFGTPTIFLGRELTPNVYLTVETGLGALFAETEGGAETWAIRLEWAIDPRTTLRGGFEPVQRGQLLRGLQFALPTTRPQQQFSLELRRRWYY
jgi:translocation and assembly module TamB